MTSSAARSVVIERLREARRSSSAVDRGRGIRLGLVVQGGGMRGVYSMAALAAFEQLGLSHGFDHAVGSSSGALNAAYMIAGQARLAVTIYLDDIRNTHFMDPLRPSRWGDIDVLVDGVLTRSPKALDIQALLASRTELFVVLTSCRTAQPVAFSTHDDVDVLQVLRATAALPIGRRGSVRIGETDYVDGALVDSIPMTQALACQCTDILAVVTRPLGSRIGALKGLDRIVARFLGRHLDPALRNLIGLPDARFNAAMSFIEGADGTANGVNVAVVAPSDQRRMVSNTTTNRRRLKDCAAMAWEDVATTLGESPGPLPAGW